MAHDPPSPSALAIEAFAASWDQQVDGVFQCPPCHDWTTSNRASIGPDPAPLSPEDVARSVQALAQNVLQLRCELTNLRLAWMPCPLTGLLLLLGFSRQPCGFG